MILFLAEMLDRDDRSVLDHKKGLWIIDAERRKTLDLVIQSPGDVVDADDAIDEFFLGFRLIIVPCFLVIQFFIRRVQDLFEVKDRLRMHRESSGAGMAAELDERKGGKRGHELDQMHGTAVASAARAFVQAIAIASP